MIQKQFYRLEATLSEYPGYDGLVTMCYDTRLYGKEISTQEAGKHLTYIQVWRETIMYWGWKY